VNRREAASGGRLTCGGELARTACEPGRTRHRGLLEAIRSDEDEEEPEEARASAARWSSGRRRGRERGQRRRGRAGQRARLQDSVLAAWARTWRRLAVVLEQGEAQRPAVAGTQRRGRWRRGRGDAGGLEDVADGPVQRAQPLVKTCTVIACPWLRQRRVRARMEKVNSERRKASRT
jgi:hypothetical protein